MQTRVVGALIFISFVALVLVYGQPSAQNCTPVPLVDAQIQTVSWIGCQLNGTITTSSGTSSVNLSADKTGCPVASKVPGQLWVRYAPSNNNVAILSDHSITDPMPPLCQATPTPSGSHYTQGYVFSKSSGGVRVPGARVELRQGSTLLATSIADANALYSFVSAPVGATLQASAPGITFAPVTVGTAQDVYLYGGAAPTPSPTPAPQCGKVAWPDTESGQDKVLDDQWKNRCRLKKNLSGKFAQFEKVSP